MEQVKSFDLIFSLFGDGYLRTQGKWFLIPESEVIKSGSNRQFGFHPGGRRVLLWRSSGPNTIVFPRSTTGGSGLNHNQHKHEEFICKIDKRGLVVNNCPCTVKTELFNDSTYLCAEPDETGLVDALKRLEFK